jgi:hypothetical protein
MQFHANTFVQRQTLDSRFSYSEQSLYQILSEVEANFHRAEEGYREGVMLVPLDPAPLWSGVTVLTEGQKLQGEFKARRDGETPRKVVEAVGAMKMPAVSGFAVMYASTVLAEDGSNELPPEEGNWECISLNASPVEGDMPIDPITLMHNHFGSDGGSDTGMSAEKFEAQMRVSFQFWKDKAMCG